ncbi:MAG: hypothetical protein V4672_11465 [Verrucomicrobiota bacterium]
MKNQKGFRVVCFMIGLGILLAISPFLWAFLGLLTGYYTGYKHGVPFADAHQKAIRTFVAGGNFGHSRFARSTQWDVWSIQWKDDHYRLESIRLMGLVPEKGERYFEKPYLPKKTSLETAVHRELSSEEKAAIQKIRSQSLPWIEMPAPTDSVEKVRVRIIAPVHADKSCLECHEVQVGAILGAFDYRFY